MKFSFIDVLSYYAGNDFITKNMVKDVVNLCKMYDNNYDKLLIDLYEVIL